MKYLTKKNFVLSTTLLVCFFLFLCWFNHNEAFTFSKNKGQLTFEKAKVLDVLSENLQPYETVPGLYRGTQELEIKILTGENKDNVYQIKNSLSRIYNVHATKGMTLIVSMDQTGTQLEPISIFSYERSPILFILIILFIALLILLGGKKGLKSVLALFFTLICVLFLFIPLLLSGYSPLIAALLVAGLTTFITLFLLNGWSKKTLAAVLGTLSGLAISGLLAYISGELAHVSTLHTPEAETLLNIAESTSMQVEGLLFAGILIAALGAVMDVGMSISSTLFELYQANPKQKPKALFLSGMNVGKDMMGTMSNTLILAFTGGSLNTLLLLYVYKMPLHQLLNIDFLAVELIQGLCGSIGVVITVPLTAFITTALISTKKAK